MIVFGDYLYAGTSGNNGTVDHSCEVWRTRNGTTWELVASLHSATMAEVECMAVFDGYLYVGTKNDARTDGRLPGPEVFRTRNGTRWDRVAEFDSSWLHVDTFCAYRGHLYAGLGGGRGKAAVFRSSDGRTWDNVTPEEIVTEGDAYAINAMTVAWDRFYLGTHGSGTGETEIWEYQE